jgi:hypothetical protein
MTRAGPRRSLRWITLVLASLCAVAVSLLLSRDERPRAGAVGSTLAREAERAASGVRGAPGDDLAARAPVFAPENEPDAPTTSSEAAGAPSPHGTTLIVDVVDANGAPVADVTVALACLWHQWTLAWAVSNADGRAAIDLDDVREPDANERPAVLALGAYDAAHAVRILRWPPPAEPVVLTLPPSGILEVEVRGREGELVEDAHVRVVDHARGNPLEFHPEVEEDLGAWSAHTRGGIARFARVQTGRDLVVSARHPVDGAVTLERAVGPAAGTVRRIALAFDPSDARYLGKVDDPIDGLWSYSVIDLTSKPRWTQRERVPFTPAGDGSFAFTLSGAAIPAEDSALWLLVQRFSHPSWSGVLVPLAGRTSGGVHDLGVLPSGSGSVLVEGRALLDGQPAPRRSLRIGVRARVDLPWHRVTAIGTDTAGEFRVWAGGGESLEWGILDDRATIPFRPGDRGIVVDFGPARPAFRLAGRVLADTRSDGTSLASSLRALARQGERTRDTQVRLDGTFEIDFDTDEPVDLELRVDWHDRPIERREALVPLAPVLERDPPLVIDVTGRLRWILVRGFDAAGEPVGIAVREATGPSRRISFLPIETLMLDRSAMDIVVSARGWQDVRLDGVATDVEVRFHTPTRTIDFLWRDMPEFPLEVRLRPVIAADGASGGSGFAGFIGSDGDVFDRAGRARAASSTSGPMVVRLEVEVRTSATSWVSTIGGRAIALAADAGTAGPVEVSWDHDEIRDLIRSMWDE